MNSIIKSAADTARRNGQAAILVSVDGFPADVLYRARLTTSGAIVWRTHDGHARSTRRVCEYMDRLSMYRPTAKVSVR